MPTHLARLLRRKPPTHIRWGLERTAAMLASLGDPHRAFDVIHVGGTNGKGSTAACAESILRAAGHKTGLYTSPHLEDFSERIRIGGKAADKELLEACARAVLPAAEDEDATFFEAATVLAFEAFRRAGCDTVVAEVGLGGRLDSTNVVSPSVTVITSISHDHSDYLGDTLEEIADEKAGILKEGVPTVIGELPDGPLEVALRRARAIGAPVDLMGRDISVADVRVRLRGTDFTYRGPESDSGWSLHTPLVGRHQAVNAALAVRSARLDSPSLSCEAIVEGIGSVHWPGRFEVYDTASGTWVFDMAHNVPAMAVLAELLEDLAVPRPLVALVAILGDKPWRDMLDPLLSVANAGIFTVAPSSPPSRHWNPEEARRAVHGAPVEVVRDFQRALRRSRELAGSGTVVVTGSTHTVGDARHRIRDQETQST